MMSDRNRSAVRERLPTLLQTSLQTRSSAVKKARDVGMLRKTNFDHVIFHDTTAFRNAGSNFAGRL